MTKPSRSASVVRLASIAQLDRALDFGSRGWGFESLWVYLIPLDASDSSGCIQSLWMHPNPLNASGWGLLRRPRGDQDRVATSGTKRTGSKARRSKVSPFRTMSSSI